MPTSPDHDSLKRSPHILPGETLCTSNTPIPIGPSGSDRPPQIDVRKEDGTVREIHVTCACGRAVTLDCETTTLV